MIKPRVSLALASLCLAFLSPFGEALAGTEGEVQIDRNQRLRLSVDLTTEYDSNVFWLSGSQQGRFRDNDAQDRASGRFAKNNSIDDFIFTPRLTLRYRQRGLWGRRFEVQGRVGYSIYAENPKKNFLSADLDFTHKTTENGTVSFENKLEYDVYRRNRLSSAVDSDGDGDISRGERVYRPAVFYETESVLSYSHKKRYGEKDDFCCIHSPTLRFNH